MRIRVLPVLTVLSILLAPVGAGMAQAQVKDLAELFPARTKVYLEMNQVGQLAKEIRTLLKGSCLEDMPKSMEKFGGAMRNDFSLIWAMQFGMFLSPEGLAEAGRLGGGAIAVMDMPKDPNQTPDMVGVLLAGDSNLPGLYMRFFLSLSFVSKVAEVEGVGLYRYRDPFNQRLMDKMKEKSDGPPQPMKAREHGPVFAMTPAAIVIGTDTKTVSDVVRRLKGKAAGQSLAMVTDFKKAAEFRDRPGLFAYADMPALVSLLVETVRSRPVEKKIEKFEKFEDKKEFEKLGKQESNPKEFGGPKGKPEKPAEGPMKELLDTSRSFRSIAAGLTLQNGVLDLRSRITFRSKDRGVWPDFFTDRTVNLDLFHYAPKNSRLALTLAMPEGTGFWDKLGKIAPLFETELSLLLGKDVLKINQLGLVLAGGRDPMLLLEAADPEAALSLAANFSRLLRLQTAIKDNMAVLGPDRQLLSQVLADGRAKKGLLEERKTALALKDHQQAHMLMVCSLSQSLVDSLRASADWRRNEKRFDKKFPEDKLDKKFDDKKEPAKEAAAEAFQDAPDQPQAKALDELVGNLMKDLEPVPPLVVSLTRKSDHLLLVGRQSHLQISLPRMVDFLVQWQMFRDRPWELPTPKVDE